MLPMTSSNGHAHGLGGVSIRHPLPHAKPWGRQWVKAQRRVRNQVEVLRRWTGGQSVLKLTIFAAFVLANVWWFGSTLMAMRRAPEEGDATAAGAQGRGVGAVWGATPHPVGRSLGRGGQSARAPPIAAGDFTADTLEVGDIRLSQNVLESGDQMYIKSKRIFLNSQPGSNVIVRGGSLLLVGVEENKMQWCVGAIRSASARAPTPTASPVETR